MSELSFNTKLVESLNDKELNEIALYFITEIEGNKGISIVDGTNDSGVDLIARDYEKINYQYQATTTKESRFLNKLKSDLQKAEKNVKDKNMPSKVLYFYSKKITQQKKVEYRKLATTNYSLKLNIYSAEDIASEAMITSELKKLLLDKNKISESDFQNNKFNNVNSRTYYDLMTIGTSNDIKFNIIKSYVINLLFKQGETSKVGVLKAINLNFESTIGEHYYDVFLKKLQTKNYIKINNSFLKISDSENKRISELHQTLNEHESHLRKSVTNILCQYNIENKIDEILKQIFSLSESRYSDTYNELIERKSDFKSFEKKVNHFKSYLETIVDEEKYNIDALIESLSEIIDNNELISIIASGSAYTKVNSLDNLQDYIQQHHNNKSIFIDTNVLVFLVLNSYNIDFKYDNPRYKIINQFFKFSYAKSLDLKTIYQYVIETSNLFKYAYKLIPLTEGKHKYLISETNNAIYKFYIHLHDNDLLENSEDFKTFLKRFGITKQAYNHTSGIEKQIIGILEHLKINVENLPSYDISKTQHLIAENSQENKSLKAITNDSKMFERLADNNIEINPIEPIFCTWDFSLISIRKKYFEVNKGCTQWFMYTPSRLIEHFSMMNLNVGYGSLTNEVLLILENDISFNSKTKSLIDNILTFIDSEDKIGLKYYEKFNEIKSKEISQIDEVASEKNELFIKDEKKQSIIISKIDILLSEFFEKQNENKNLLEQFFKDDKYIEKFVDVLFENISYLTKYKKINDDYHINMSNLLEEFGKEQESHK
ncbi:hypothetical protein [uncultured Tenacibaculum sp.]|uniref:hypothetical protein n=1 Tax=uncultured Tenacibaculum sp. TaxID=174713 RepID=UPI00261077E9|nr:hypothetical protein [uncultured Tenacibaculum sp.]